MLHYKILKIRYNANNSTKVKTPVQILLIMRLAANKVILWINLRVLSTIRFRCLEYDSILGNYFYI
jgi:transposase